MRVSYAIGLTCLVAVTNIVESCGGPYSLDEGVFVRMYMEPGDYSTFGVVTDDEAGLQQMKATLREIKVRALADY